MPSLSERAKSERLIGHKLRRAEKSKHAMWVSFVEARLIGTVAGLRQVSRHGSAQNGLDSQLLSG